MFFLASFILAAILSCCGGQESESTAYKQHIALTDVDPSGYLPKMGEYITIDTECPEVSGLCLAQDGRGLLAASDEHGLYHIS